MPARGLLTGTFLAGALLATAIAAPAAVAAPPPSGPAAQAPAAAPVPVTSVTCDGDTYKCTAKLQYGDGRWVAQWGVSVVHQ